MGKKSAEDILASASGMFKRVKLGPGLIGNLSIVLIALFVSIGIVCWALSAHPIQAACASGFLLLFAVYVVERLVRFAEKDPAAALLGSAEFYHHLRDQSAAKDKSILIEGPNVGGGPRAIDHRSVRDE
ncbi:hypothetical protein HNQ36_000096 [Afipia massiliensis]|uniref:Uncharacterized protein n=1 Tax=Afipia massiliensis TaxID=211460 RepID=A0A840MWQ0_9BRAD|nr:hypothetical protein [Afipia massiliensis]MBB5050148.1 hypothetical protein [Afipia massiliensis]